jgi:hypothetical protein
MAEALTLLGIIIFVVGCFAVCFEPYFDYTIPGYRLRKREWLVADINERKIAAERERINDEAFTKALMRNAK